MFDLSLVFQYKVFLLTFLLVLIRVASIVSFIPVINHPAFPMLVKVIFSLFLALMLTPLLIEKGILFDTKLLDSPLTLTLGILNEIFFGFAVLYG